MTLLEYLDAEREEVNDEELRLVTKALLEGQQPVKVMALLIDKDSYAEGVYFIDGEFYSAMFSIKSTGDGPEWIERAARVLH